VASSTWKGSQRTGTKISPPETRNRSYLTPTEHTDTIFSYSSRSPQRKERRLTPLVGPHQRASAQWLSGAWLEVLTLILLSISTGEHVLLLAWVARGSLHRGRRKLRFLVITHKGHTWISSLRAIMIFSLKNRKNKDISLLKIWNHRQNNGLLSSMN
jgi:hypothetical protein